MNPIRNHCGRNRGGKSIWQAASWCSTIRLWRNRFPNSTRWFISKGLGKQKAVVSGINLITLLWTDGVRWVPVDYRVFDKDRDGKTKNDQFSDMLMAAFERGFQPKLVCFDSWYGSVENLKLVRSLGWHFLTRLKANRQIRVGGGKLQAVSDTGLAGGDGTICWLKGFGEIKVFRVCAMDGASEYWATSLREMTEA